MKTIEERVEYWTRYCWERGISATSGTREALRELAADLQAEHGTEKERLCREIGDLRKQLKIDADVHLHATERHKASMAKLIEENDRLNHLNAEKEKEVAELRAANQRIANESIANQLALQSVCYKQRAALEYYAGAPWVGHAGSWANSNIAEPANVALENKFDSSLLDEVKRVLTWYVGEVGPDFECTCEHCRNHAAAHNLLTRLGGSHE